MNEWAIPLAALVVTAGALIGKLMGQRRTNGVAANQLEALRRDLIAEIRREREGLSKELEDAMTRLALELTRELRLRQ